MEKEQSIEGWLVRDLAGELRFFAKDEDARMSGEPIRRGGRWIGYTRLLGQDLEWAGIVLPYTLFREIQFVSLRPKKVKLTASIFLNE